jgi:diketogulonate reductase-like aldo/keto reductase
MQGGIIRVQELKEMGEKYGKNPAQIVLRWNLQSGVLTIPKSANHDRIKSNADIFDFELSAADLQLIDNLDRGQRLGPDPDNFDF